MVAILLALLAAVGFSLNGMFARLGSQSGGPLAGVAISLVPSFVLATTLALILDMSAYFELPLVAFFWIALMGMLQYPLARMFNYTAISRIGAARASPLFTTQTLFALVLAIIFLGERPNPAIILGTLAVVAGVFLILTERRSSESTDKD